MRQSDHIRPSAIQARQRGAAHPRRGPAGLAVARATIDDAAAIAAVRNDAAERLTERFGHGHWSRLVSERVVASGIERGHVLVVRARAAVCATLCLTPRKPWAIDPAHFTAVPAPIYLIDMAVAPDWQRRGVGRV
jgi:GNAT superfamily N-acetyltransferase